MGELERPLERKKISRLRQLEGLGVYGDFSFGYYKDRSLRGIAKEIRAKGFSWVCAYSSYMTPELAEALQAEGVAIMLGLWGTIIYRPEELELPPPDDGKQVFVRGPHKPDANPVSYCSNSDAFVEWYREMVKKDLSVFRPDMVILGEAFLGAWVGPSSDSYGCFCDNCLSKFKEQNPDVDGFPEFNDESSDDYWEKNTELYEKWVAFRAESTSRFFTHVYATVLEEMPDVPIAGGMLAIDHPEGIAKVREFNAQDVNILADLLPWDMFMFQAHWPDWCRMDLQAEYHPKSYRPFLDAIRQKNPDLRVAMSTDIGSNPEMRRSMPWIDTAYIAARAEGFDALGLYEYAVGKYLYEDRPEVIEITASADKDEIEVIFSKRMDPDSAVCTSNYRLDDGDQPKEIRFDGGNIVTLVFEQLDRDRDAQLEIKDVLDDANTMWFNKGATGKNWRYPPNAVNPNAVNEFRIPK